MRRYRLALIAISPLLLAASQRTGRVCPNPAHPCAGFRAHDLSFVLPTDGVARAEARSDSLYAVILRSAPRCSIPERDRVAAQRLFPGRKVFSQRFECDDDIENNVSYTGVNPSRAFLAVYAGATRPQADATLAAVARTHRFPGANVRRMQVVFNYP
ncbi:MAG TPA: hypothetical protein VGO40_10585 [Longimicrobium sp.]|jgi:hypothetical protein|nr:hypothetical protein [Longimicrobium sp.]